MRAVVQRVSEAGVSINGAIHSRIGKGLLVFVGVERGDDEKDIDYIASKISTLRIFDDEAGRMNRSVMDIGGSILIVSQFTLLGDVRRGRRPSFDRAELPQRAEGLYKALIKRLVHMGIDVKEGIFGAEMEIGLKNIGPVTILLDSRRLF